MHDVEKRDLLIRLIEAFERTAAAQEKHAEIMERNLAIHEAMLKQNGRNNESMQQMFERMIRVKNEEAKA